MFPKPNLGSSGTDGTSGSASSSCLDAISSNPHKNEICAEIDRLNGIRASHSAQPLQ